MNQLGELPVFAHQNQTSHRIQLPYPRSVVPELMSALKNVPKVLPVV